MDVRRVFASAAGGSATRYPLCDPLVAARLSLAWCGFYHHCSAGTPFPASALRAIRSVFVTTARLVLAVACLPARGRRTGMGDGRTKAECAARLSVACRGTVPGFLQEREMAAGNPLAGQRYAGLLGTRWRVSQQRRFLA